MRKIFSAILAGVMVINLIACSSGDSSKSLEPPDLSGQWKQVNSESEDSYQGAIIEDDVIEIYWVSNNGDTRSLYWSGSFVKPDTSEEPYTWDSKNNKARTEFSLMASNDDIKTFTYEGGQISYSSSIMGTTSKIRLEKEEWEPGLEIEKVELLDLSGQWKQTNSDIDGYYYGAIISGDTIEIYNASDVDDIRTLYWAGSFTPPDTSDESYAWISKNDTGKTDLSPLASQADTKSFTYESGTISYSATSQGTTSTIYLTKENWAPDLHQGESYETTHFPFSIAGIEFSIPEHLKEGENSSENSVYFSSYLRGQETGALLSFEILENIDISQTEFEELKNTLTDYYSEIFEYLKLHDSNDITIAGLPGRSIVLTGVNKNNVDYTSYIDIIYNNNQSKVILVALALPKAKIHSEQYFNNIIESAKLIETEQPTSTSNPTNGIRPEFKEAIDSYEEFFDEYATFMKKYSESENAFDLLSDYSKFMEQYAETMAAMNKLGEEEMSAEESLYYIEVTNRINQKLLSVVI